VCLGPRQMDVLASSLVNNAMWICIRPRSLVMNGLAFGAIDDSGNVGKSHGQQGEVRDNLNGWQFGVIKNDLQML